MDTIEIRVNKQMDGYTFSTLPTVRQLIKSWFPDAHPANNIFVGYDTKSDFELYYRKLESYLYPALLGIDDNQCWTIRLIKSFSLIPKPVMCWMYTS